MSKTYCSGAVVIILQLNKFEQLGVHMVSYAICKASMNTIISDFAFVPYVIQASKTRPKTISVVLFYFNI